MAFSFGTNGSQSIFGAPNATLGANPQVKLGQDLEVITTEALGFLALGGEAKVQLLQSPWPSNNLPPPTASVMSIASQKGLLAAAGPDAVIVASTESVRAAFKQPRSGDSELRPFRPQLILPMPMRVSQVAFTADESYLILSAETGGGLAVYEVQSLLSGSTQRAFEMPTNSQSLRALVPNPTPEKGELLAVVTTDGKLMMANLKERKFVSGVNGQVLKESVSCVSWSTKGKQLVAGLGDGSCFQMTPEGESKGNIPRAPNADPNHHVSSITWLENNVFLTVSSTSDFDRDSLSDFYVVTRQSTPSEFIFEKIADPATPYGLERYPPHHFLLRLKDFPPNIMDLLIVASSASTDIGLFSRSKTPLAADKPPDRITGVFTMTELYDSRRAQMSLTDDGRDTSPIGVGLDLSSGEKVVRPIPSDEMDESSAPVPALMVLNNEGVIASWWVIYSESVKQGLNYPGLTAVSAVMQSTPVSQQQKSPFAGLTSSTASNPTNPAVAYSGFKQASAFGAPSTLAANSSTAFGAPSGLNQAQPLWGRPASSNAPSTGVAFGTSSFGSTTASNAQGVAFGASALPGNRVSPWATTATKAPGATFGQPASLSMPGGSTFGNTSGVGLFGSGTAGMAEPSSGGFASFAGQGGFAAAAAHGTGTNIFGSSPATTALGAPINNPSKEPASVFGNGNPTTTEKSEGFLSAGGFRLGSTFKPDESAKDDKLNPNNEGSSFFGSGFDTALVDAQEADTPVIDEADMDTEDPQPEPQEEPDGKANLSSDKPMTIQTGFISSTTPTSTPAAPKFLPPTTASPIKGSSFAAPIPSEASATTSTKPSDTTLSFASLTKMPDQPISSTSVEAPLPVQTPTSPKSPKGPKIKEELHSDEGTETNMSSIPEAPLPPDPTSKASYLVGDSSASSIEPEAPLPPDFIPAAIPKKAGESTPPVPEKKTETSPAPELIPPSYVPDGPEEGEDSDFGSEYEDDQSGAVSEEGSGEDVAKDISPTSELHHTPGFTPQSSFGGSTTRANPENFFTKIAPQSKDAALRPLFGEINKASTPALYPQKLFPNSRSPSPIRNPLPGRLLRPDASRSVSAPGVASQILGAQKPTSERLSITPLSSFTSSLEQKKAEEERRAEAKRRKEAEETQALIDKEDESIQNFLKQEVVGNKTLDDFIAHQDYVGNADKDSMPAQVEAVYRDINSMIDTLGMNSCSLKRFIKGHTEQYKKSRRTMLDLEGGEDWCLVEIDSLSNIVTRDLATNLDQGRIKDMPLKLEACTELERDLAKLRAKHEDIKMLLASYSDPENAVLARSQPLTAEQIVQQHDLRRDFTKFQKLLGEAEEGLTLLRTKLAYHGNTTGDANPGPTVEAVMRTIVKMTNMAERRSGDIDVLENQMRKLRLSSTTSNGSREASPFATPASKASMRAPGTSSTYSAFYTPNSIKDTPYGLHASLASSTNSYSRGSPSPRRKVSGFSDEDKHRLKANAVRKKGVTDRLKKALGKNGVRVQSMDSE